MFIKVPGYPQYEVSKAGLVWSHQRGRLLVPWLHTSRCGFYPRVGLCFKGRRRLIFVHELVMLAFVGPKKAGLEVDHINGTTTDNRLANLRYVTPQENVAAYQKLLKRGA